MFTDLCVVQCCNKYHWVFPDMSALTVESDAHVEALGCKVGCLCGTANSTNTSNPPLNCSEWCADQDIHTTAGYDTVGFEKSWEVKRGALDYFGVVGRRFAAVFYWYFGGSENSNYEIEINSSTFFRNSNADAVVACLTGCQFRQICNA
eukprot:gb/GEZN01026689.1/.p1 GENE.gb/GEZN01026689.1/~~gb/GEZN01026689.1/.p1  ORF type:complete len:166 (-),score=2.96 gb/GEZN01026689.1/:19-465(-)